MNNEVDFINGLLNYLHVTRSEDIDLTSDDVECIVEALELLKEHYTETKDIKPNGVQ